MRPAAQGVQRSRPAGAQLSPIAPERVAQHDAQRPKRERHPQGQPVEGAGMSAKEPQEVRALAPLIQRYSMPSPGRAPGVPGDRRGDIDNSITGLSQAE